MLYEQSTCENALNLKNVLKAAFGKEDMCLLLPFVQDIYTNTKMSLLDAHILSCFLSCELGKKFLALPADRRSIWSRFRTLDTPPNGVIVPRDCLSLVSL